MDTDWCLTCDCHFQGIGPYCSPDCKDRAGPSRPSNFSLDSPSPSCSDLEDYEDEIIYHHVDDVVSWNGSASIIAWASEIPPSSSTSSGTSTPRSVCSSPSFSSSKPPSPNRSFTFLPPKLLRSNHRPVAPSLCMTTTRPAHPSPSHPILAPQQHIAAALSMSRFGDADSMGKSSVLSALTESSLATPVSTQSVPFAPSKALSEQPSILGAIATHVRSWVSPTPPLLASSTSSLSKQRISAPLPNKGSDAQKLTVIAHNYRPRSSAMDIAFSSPSSADDTAPVWHLSSTILVDTPNPKVMRDTCGNHLPYKPRGRTLSRAIA